MRVSQEAVSAAAIGCLIGACGVMAAKIHTETRRIHADVARHTEDVHVFVAAVDRLIDSDITDSCGCPGPYEVCRDVCTACICAHMPDVWVPVDEARRKCWRECDP